MSAINRLSKCRERKGTYGDEAEHEDLSQDEVDVGGSVGPARLRRLDRSLPSLQRGRLLHGTGYGDPLEAVTHRKQITLRSVVDTTPTPKSHPSVRRDRYPLRTTRGLHTSHLGWLLTHVSTSLGFARRPCSQLAKDQAQAKADVMTQRIK
jgi:hypothetical protein